MGKPKRNIRKKKGESALGSDDEDLYRDLKNPDSTSREFIFNEIDEFNINREKISLNSDEEVDKATRSMKEEVFALSDSEDEDEEDYQNDYYSRMAQKDEIASDIEDNPTDNLPNVKAWGKKKYAYYNTDYVDQDYGGFQGSDAEMAEAEEKEAVSIQKRMLQHLDEEDFAMDFLPAQGTLSEDQKVSVDLSKLTDQDKLQLLQKESPELLVVVEDFKNYMQELRETILPLLPLVEDGRIPPGPGADYLQIKKTLIYAYCTNIAFYMTVRSKDVKVRNHPVMKRLLTFRKFLQQLQPLREQLEPQVQSVLGRLRLGLDIEVGQDDSTDKNSKLNGLKRTQSKKTKVSFEENPKKFGKTEVGKACLETADEREALAMYQMMKSNNKKKQAAGSSDEDSSEDLIAAAASENESELETGENEEDLPSEKRGITFQIAKNKGLMPHRKKEYRNPRVRHRVKFQKAKVRRKGQFKQPRTETQRYGGEASGIRIGSKRGTKLK